MKIPKDGNESCYAINASRASPMAETEKDQVLAPSGGMLQQIGLEVATENTATVMAQAEMVTVRMSRGQLSTPWGFAIGPALSIINVIGGSLADRAGLLNGDVLVELEGHQNLNIELAKQLLSKTEHRVELIVHRTAGNITHRIWQPSVTENTEYNKFQHSVLNVGPTDTQKAANSNTLLKVSLEHQNPESIAIPGFNVKAQPFGDHQEVKHLQYNSPMPLYSPQTAAEQYLQQTGGLFGTDPSLTKQKEVPSYLRSETLRLIQESERSKENGEHMVSVKTTEATQEKAQLNVENVSGPPMCFICGRIIKGMMCRAHDRTVHGECFQCSTCGGSLKNQGHHFINDKFYCDVHGRQLRRGSNAAKHDEIQGQQLKIGLTPDRNALLASYQPEVMTRQSISISPTPWKTQSPISPSNRGVPPAATHYGQELNELKKEIYNSSINSGNAPDQQYETLRSLSRVRSLSLEIRKVISLRRLPCKHHWPPDSHKIKRLVIALSVFIKENEEKRQGPPSFPNDIF
uniref:PDZ domain-containing protein n=1 Tax=Setaria digitata TaxID=48799 RepID=A0A915Q120_9BILA